MKAFSLFSIFAALVLAMTAAPDVRAAGGSCENKELVETGEMVGVATSVGFLIGARWGEGIVRMTDGTKFKFKAKGVKVSEFGAAKFGFRGTIYNLKSPAEFAGVYTGLGGGLTVGKGVGFAHYQNANCVVVKLKREKVIGVQASMPMLGAVKVELVE